MSWQSNTIMEWSIDDGVTWIKITDHGRSALNVDVEAIESKQRMVNGTLRRYVVTKKRTFSCSWDNLPNRTTTFLANGETPGEWFEAFYNTYTGAFLMRLRGGSDQAALTLTRAGTETAQDNERLFKVMMVDYSKEVVRRGQAFDLWNISITLEEV